MAHRFFGVLSLSFILMASTAMAAETAPASGFTDAQKTQIEEVVKNLLTSKEPGIVMTAVKEFQRKQEEETTLKSKEALAKHKDKLALATDPFVGNAKGDVTVVEFFDYNCGYCKKANPTVRKLIEEDKNVRLVYKEFPILAESSRTAAKAALAAGKQNRYADFHNALMEHKGQLSDDVVMEIAGKLGLDKEKLKKDMEAPDVTAQLAANQELGVSIGARGTPTFVIGEKLFPGALELEDLKTQIAEARKTPKK